MIHTFQGNLNLHLGPRMLYSWFLVYRVMEFVTMNSKVADEHSRFAIIRRILPVSWLATSGYIIHGTERRQHHLLHPRFEHDMVTVCTEPFTWQDYVLFSQPSSINGDVIGVSYTWYGAVGNVTYYDVFRKLTDSAVAALLHISKMDLMHSA